MSYIKALISLFVSIYISHVFLAPFVYVDITAIVLALLATIAAFIIFESNDKKKTSIALIIHLILLVYLSGFVIYDIYLYLTDGITFASAHLSHLIFYVVTFIYYVLWRYIPRIFMIISLLLLIIAPLFTSTSAFLSLLYIMEVIFLYLDIKKEEIYKIFVFIVITITSIFIFFMVTPYDVLRNVDDLILHKLEPDPCPRRLRHYLGLCNCADNGIFKKDGQIVFGNEVSLPDGYIRAGLGQGLISNDSITDDDEIYYHVTSTEPVTYLKAFSAGNYSSTSNRFNLMSDDRTMLVYSSDLASDPGAIYRLDHEASDYITIERTDAGNDRYFLVPYGLNDLEVQLISDCSYRDEDITESYTIGFDNSEFMRDDLIDIYSDDIASYYLNLSSSTKEEMQEFLREQGIDPNGDDKQAIIDAIVDLLKNNYTYSREIEVIDDDAIMNFLYHTHSGYCVHFAGSATLLLRASGIPARYVGGYHIREWNKDEAIIRASDAHAWVEVYSADVGWVPYEVTASYEDSFGIENDFEELDEEDVIETPEVTETPEIKETTRPETPQREEVVERNDIDIAAILLNIVIIMSIIAIPAISFIIFISYRRRRPYRDKVRTSYLFIEKYCEVDKNIIAIMEKRRFSKEGIDKNDYLIVKAKEKEVAKELSKKISTLKKIYLFIRYDVWML